MSEGTISETPLFRSAFSTSSPFCRIPTRNEKREKYNTHASSFLHTRLSFAPCHFIQQRRERFVSTPRPQQPFKPFLVRQKSIVEKIQSPLFSISFLPFVFFNYTVDTPSNRRGEGKRYKKKKKKENSTSRNKKQIFFFTIRFVRNENRASSSKLPERSFLSRYFSSVRRKKEKNKEERKIRPIREKEKPWSRKKRITRRTRRKRRANLPGTVAFRLANWTLCHLNRPLWRFNHDDETSAATDRPSSKHLTRTMLPMLDDDDTRTHTYIHTHTHPTENTCTFTKRNDRRTDFTIHETKRVHPREFHHLFLVTSRACW